MLDFYAINDTISKPNGGPKNLAYAGGLEYEDFEYLKKIKLIEDWVDFYKDFRWTYEQVAEKYNILFERNKIAKGKSESSEIIMLNILEKATNTNNGLIAYAD